MSSNDIVSSALEDAKAVVVREPFPDELVEESVYETRLYDHAFRAIIHELSGLTRAMIRMIHHMAEGERWRLLDEGYESLSEYVQARFEPYLKESNPTGGVYTWDYVRRFIPMVENVLLPLQKITVLDKNGKPITPDDVIDNAPERALNQMAYAHSIAEPETQQKIVQAMAEGATPRVFEDLKKQARKEKRIRDGGNSSGDDEDYRVIKLSAQESPDGDMIIHGRISYQDFLVLEAITGGKVEFRLGIFRKNSNERMDISAG